MQPAVVVATDVVTPVDVTTSAFVDVMSNGSGVAVSVTMTLQETISQLFVL